MSAIAYHITIGTYGTRLHGGVAPTVARPKNHLGDSFVLVDPKREMTAREKMKETPCYFSEEQRRFVELVTPEICEQGKWQYHIVACQNDHIHLLVSSDVEPKLIRRWYKTWLTKQLNEKYEIKQWLVVDGGSTKWINDERYFKSVFEYIRKQRTVPLQTDINNEPESVTPE